MYLSDCDCVVDHILFGAYVNVCVWLGETWIEYLYIFAKQIATSFIFIATSGQQMFTNQVERKKKKNMVKWCDVMRIFSYI